MSDAIELNTVIARREDLSQELADKLIADHAEVMKRFGYLNEDGELIY